MDGSDAVLRALTLLGSVVTLPSAARHLLRFAFGVDTRPMSAGAPGARSGNETTGTPMSGNPTSAKQATGDEGVTNGSEHSRAYGVACLAALPGQLAWAGLAGVVLVPPPWAAGPSDLPVLVAIGAALALCLWAAKPGAIVRALRDTTGAGLRRLETRPIVLGLVLGISVPAIAAALATQTSLDTSTAARPSAERAARRLWVVPWDPDAHLALGWVAASREQVDVARGHLDAAERAGVDRMAALELSSELAAQQGDCAAARAVFERAMQMRIERAFSEVLTRPLDVASYTLPPTLVRRCGVSSP